MSGAPRFDDAERAAILAEWDAVARAGQPQNPGPLGCATAVLAVIALAAMPALARKFSLELPRAAVLVVFVALVLAALGGLLVGLFGGGIATGRVRARAEDALDFLARNYPGGDAARLRHAAVVAIFDAFYSGGPWTAHTYDFQQAAASLGPALAYVQEVEHVLRQQRSAYPVFTSD